MKTTLSKCQLRATEKNQFIKLFVAIVTMLFSLNFVSCKDDDVEDPDLPEINILENLSAYQGIWKATAVGVSGVRVPLEKKDSLNLYAVADPMNNDMALIFTEDEEDENLEPELYFVKQSITQNSIVLIDVDKHQDYHEDPNSVYSIEFSYKALSENEIMATFMCSSLFDDETDPDSLVLYFDRHIEYENKVSELTRGLLWAVRAARAVAGFITGKDTQTLAGYTPYVTTKPRENYNGWKPANWMSNLEDSLPVARVNIPGSHDSSATYKAMDYLTAFTVDACVQDYSVKEQFERGARYFDLRVGYPMNLSLTGKYDPTQEEKDTKKDLMMYHGPLPTYTMFVETLKDLAGLIKKNSKEFVFINVQAEVECTGLAVELGNKIKDLGIGKLHNAVRTQSMYVANRLLRELNHEYGDSLFVIYRPGLTVREARGHMIVFVDHKDRYNDKNETDSITYYEKWPVKASSYANLVYYKDSVYVTADSKQVHTLAKVTKENALFVQSQYEMLVNEKEKIDNKYKEMKSLAETVTATNEKAKNNNYVLGFNSANANTGDPTGLKTMIFAYLYNGNLYEVFRNNMDNTASPNSSGRFHCGIVPMDHYGYDRYVSDMYDMNVWGDYLSWAVIESNFYKKE